MYPIMLLEIIVIAENGCLVLSPRQARDAIFVADRVINVLRKVLECCILTDLLKLSSFFHNAFGFGEETELADALVCDRLLREVSCVIHAS